MKKAAIVIGKPNSGKSTTIRGFMAMVTMEGAHKFTLNGRRGYIYLSSFEEADRDIEKTIKKLSGYDLLVLACQGPKLLDVHSALKKALFVVKDVHIQRPPEAGAKAQEVFDFLN